MKTILRASIILIFASVLLGNSSCIAYKKDNGKHKGWFKNPKNPHHPASSKTKGNAKAKGKGH